MTKTRSTSTTAADDDGGRDAMPIFTPVLPPRLSSTSHASLVQWRKERREYDETVRNRAKGGAEDKIVPIRTTFDEGLLRMWCSLRWQISIDDVTDEVILTEIDNIISCVKNNNVPDVDDEMREMLRMDLSESDVSERVIQYFKLCHDIIDDHGWQQFFSGDDGKKQLCRVLIALFEPRALREEVERTVRFQARAAKSDEVILHDLVLEKALDQGKNNQNQRRAKRDRSDGDSGRAPKRGPSKSSTKKPRLTTERSTSSSKPPTKKTFSERAKVPRTPCPHCDEMHWLSECPTSSDDQKAENRRKLREQRANDGNKRVVARMKRLRECIPSQEKTRDLRCCCGGCRFRYIH
ncbi:hypothetical protein F443_11005 [Phytophthora nicotianae P1569]|uniref:Uncharacterized protein n=1 Tax=Phytophthora nicotianae P1569 TaxID=1317065 RepID=V9EYC4_PHYNI|nr:hypothetical protein F443_11005 [Phytophthora nicotianae P1569]